MRLADFKNLHDEVCAEALELFARKNESYASLGEIFENIDACAALTGLSRRQTVAVFLEKQLQAIRAWVRTGAESEPIRSRVIDTINFLVMLLATAEADFGTDNGPDVSPAVEMAKRSAASLRVEAAARAEQARVEQARIRKGGI